MQTKFGCSVLFITVALVVSVGRANPGTRSPEASQIERGRYLVEDVANCAECHTPRNAQGELDRHAWLERAPIWIMPVKPIPIGRTALRRSRVSRALRRSGEKESSRKEQGLRAKRYGRRCTSTT